MIESVFTYLYDLMYSSALFALLASFIWGLLSILLSPCHLSSIPLIIGYIGSYGEISLAKGFRISLVFSLGILITIALIGAVTAAMGRIMGDVGAIGNYLVALVFFAVGLYLMGVIYLPWEGKIIKGTQKKGYSAALILGLLFGIGLGPCTFAFMAPVLGIVFETAQTNVLLALLYLTAFAAGHCAVITGAGTVTGRIQHYLNWTEKSNTVLWIKRICGLLVILGGVYLIIK